MDTTSSSIHFKPTCCFQTKTYISAGLLLASSLLGFLCGTKQMVIWFKHLRHAEERRKPSSHPHVVFFLALGNTITCGGLTFVSLGLFLLNTYKSQVKNGFRIVPYHMIAWTLPFEILVTLGFVLSGWFTVIYLFDVCLQVHHRKSLLALYHAIAWIGSLAALAVVLVFRYRHGDIRACKSHKELVPLILFWLSLILTLIAVSVIALCFFDRQVKADLYRLGNAYTRNERGLMLKIRLKFALLVSIFTICWIPTMMIGFISVIGVENNWLEVLHFMELALNPLQPALNYYIFIPWGKSRDVVPPLSERSAMAVANIQDVFGASIGSSLLESIRIRSPGLPRSMSATAHFHFTPCPFSDDEEEPLLRGEMQVERTESLAATTDSDDSSLVIGKLLGE